MKIKALGMIEVLGYLGAIEAADCALKSANVELLGVEKIGAGIVTVMITGDVASINSAVEAGTAAAEKLGSLRASSIIARLHEDTANLLQKKNIKHQEELEEEKDLQLIHTEEPEEKPEEELKVIKSEVLDKRKQLAVMKVEQLRRMARSMKVKTLTKEEIKFAKKEKLIEEIIRYSKEEEK